MRLSARQRAFWDNRESRSWYDREDPDLGGFVWMGKAIRTASYLHSTKALLLLDLAKG